MNGYGKSRIGLRRNRCHRVLQMPVCSSRKPIHYQLSAKSFVEHVVDFVHAQLFLEAADGGVFVDVNHFNACDFSNAAAHYRPQMDRIQDVSDSLRFVYELYGESGSW